MLPYSLCLLLATALVFNSHSVTAFPLSEDSRLQRRQSSGPQTIRKYWPASGGRTIFNYNSPLINHDSVVAITAAQFWTMDNKTQEVRLMNNIPITVEAIVPHGPPYDANHGVSFVVNIDSSWIINIVTDITVFPSTPIEIQQYTPTAPTDIGLAKVWQYQESAKWGWIATAASISHFYAQGGEWSQCQLMTVIGQKLNGFPTTSSACPSEDILLKYPNLQTILNTQLGPTTLAALYVLDNPFYNIPTYYLKTGGVDDALKQTTHFASDQGATVSLAAITNEINAKRPVVASIAWNGGGGQFVTIGGVSGDILLLFDPVNGQSTMRFEDFPAGYYGGATITGYTFTSPVLYD